MRKLTISIPALLFSAPVFAHHPLSGMPMETFAHGILSGVGHPLLGFDHLFFVILVGIASRYTRHRYTAPLAYIAAMLGGCLVTSLSTALPASELMIALSLLVAGSMLLSGHRFSTGTVLLVFAGFGLFHGSAFGDTLASQEAGFGPLVLIGYLFGLGITQYALALGSGWIWALLWKTSQAGSIQPRLAGAMVAGAGLYLTLEQLEGPLLKMISS